MTDPGPTTPLEEARAWLKARLENGEHCPCCTQLAKVYRRSISSGMATALARLHKAGGTTWVHKPTVLRGVGSASRDESLLRFWGLIEEERAFRRDDGGRAGYWRVTEKGESFLRGDIVIPKYALIYDSRLLRFGGDVVTFEDCLGVPFSYAELMAGV